LMAWCLRLRFDDSMPFDRAAQRGLAALTLSLGLLKLTAFVLSPLILTIPAARFTSARARWYFAGTVIAGCAAITAIWNGIYHFVPAVYWNTGGDPAGAIQTALAKPVQIVILFYTSTRDLGLAWWLDSYSRFGAHPIPFYFYTSTANTGWAAAAGIAALAIADGSKRPDWLLALLYLVVALAYTVVVLAAFYVGFTPPGAATVMGLQGRYFILPWALIVIAMALAAPGRAWLAPFRILLLLGVLAVHTVVIHEAIDRYRTTTWTTRP
jgi:uncharacterized membrane protein